MPWSKEVGKNSWVILIVRVLTVQMFRSVYWNYHVSSEASERFVVRKTSGGATCELTSPEQLFLMKLWYVGNVIHKRTRIDIFWKIPTSSTIQTFTWSVALKWQRRLFIKFDHVFINLYRSWRFEFWVFKYCSEPSGWIHRVGLRTDFHCSN